MKCVHSTMITDVLEAEILDGGLPPGSRRNEEVLAQRFGVSRSREERVPYKGVVVREFEMQRVQTMCDTTALYP